MAIMRLSVLTHAGHKLLHKLSHVFNSIVRCLDTIHSDYTCFSLLYKLVNPNNFKHLEQISGSEKFKI